MRCISTKQPITIQQLSAKMVRGCKNMSAVYIQNVFDGMVNQRRICKNAARDVPSNMTHVINVGKIFKLYSAR